MMLRHDLRTDAHICGKSARQASLFGHHGRDVNRVYYDHEHDNDSDEQDEDEDDQLADGLLTPKHGRKIRN